VRFPSARKRQVRVQKVGESAADVVSGTARGDDGGVHRWLTVTGEEWLAERPANADEDVHFSAGLVERMINEYTAPSELVLDPFAGFGTTLVVAERLGRRGIGVEYDAERATRASTRLGANASMIAGDARRIANLVTDPVDLCLTSPPYMSRTDYPENPLTAYTTNDGRYDVYLDELGTVFKQVATLLRPGGWLVINVANVVHAGSITPLAFDLTRVVAATLPFRGEITVVWDGAPDWMTGDYLLTFQRPTRSDRRRWR